MTRAPLWLNTECLVGLIAVICVVAVTTLGTEVSTALSTIASALSGI